jgi:hypothetical protein
MTPPTVGSVHLDRTTGRLLVDGVPVCTGCGRPSDTRFCCSATRLPLLAPTSGSPSVPEVTQLLPIVVALLVGLVVGILVTLAFTEPGAVEVVPPRKDPEIPPPPKQQQSVLDSLGLPAAAAHRRTVSVPVPAPDPLKDDSTRAIRKRIAYPQPQPPWARATHLHADSEPPTADSGAPTAEYPAVHRRPDEPFRPFIHEVPTVEAPLADWSKYATELLPVVGEEASDG